MSDSVLHSNERLEFFFVVEESRFLYSGDLSKKELSKKIIILEFSEYSF